ncbi:MAG: radical SAM protein [Candidatus Woesearchaeota archaeon]
MAEAFIKLDYRCNQKCLFCCTADDKDVLSYENAKGLVDKYMEMDYKQIAFSGGEPTLVDYLPKIIRYSRSKGARVKLQTNALLLSEKKYAQKIINSGINIALISVHSNNPITNDKITQVKNSLKRSLNGIKHLYDAGIEIHIAYVITKLNKDLIDFLKFIDKNFPKITNFQIFVPWAISRGWENRHLVPKFSEIEKNLKEAFEYCKKNKKNFVTRGIPLCHMMGYDDHSTETRALKSNEKAMIVNDYKDDKPRHSFEESNSKEPQCRLCSKYHICGGAWNTYPKIYPNDLWPIYE